MVERLWHVTRKSRASKIILAQFEEKNNNGRKLDFIQESEMYSLSSHGFLIHQTEL